MSTFVEHGFEISGTAAARPTNGDAGIKRWNTTTKRLEVWDGTEWHALGDANVGAENGTGVTAAERSGVVHQTVLTLDAVSITMTDATTNGCHGSLKVYDFPQGNIAILGGTCDLTTLAGAGGIGDTAALIGSVGTATVGTGNATLTTTEADIIPSTTGSLTAGAGTLKGRSATAGIAVFDGTSSAIDAFLNLAVPDAGSSADDTITVSGTITITWLNLGDV